MLFFGCSEEASQTNAPVPVTLTFNHNWDGESITGDDLNTLKFANANGQLMSVELLRYLISDVTFERADGQSITLDGYHLIDVTRDTGLSFSLPQEVPVENYSNVSFTFGFDNEDNVDGAYLDLNSVSWNVPMMLGGGYHFMQLEGKFIDASDTETGYQYHAIRAVDNAGETQRFQDTFFTVNLGPVDLSQNTTIGIGMNVAEWFKNPNLWDLNVLGSRLMPNFNAQVMIYENGQSVFALDNTP